LDTTYTFSDPNREELINKTKKLPTYEASTRNYLEQNAFQSILTNPQQTGLTNKKFMIGSVNISNEDRQQ
jgi:hypothetical protein